MSPYVDFSPFSDQDFNEWKKESNGTALITAQEDGNHYIRFPEDYAGAMLGPLLKKTISGFKPGSRYRFSADFRQVRQHDLFQSRILLSVDKIPPPQYHSVSLLVWERVSFDFTAEKESHDLIISGRDVPVDKSDCALAVDDAVADRGAAAGGNVAIDFIRVFEVKTFSQTFDDYPNKKILPGTSFETDHLTLELKSDQPGSIFIHSPLLHDTPVDAKEILCLAHNGGNWYRDQTTVLTLKGSYQRATFNWFGIQQPATAKAFDKNDKELCTQDITPQPNETINHWVQLVAPRETLIHRIELTCRNRTFIDRIDFEAE